MVDEIYNHKVKLIIKSEVALVDLFKSDSSKTSEEVFMAQRCLSRLMEIQTQAYLNQPHQEQK